MDCSRGICDNLAYVFGTELQDMVAPEVRLGQERARTIKLSVSQPAFSHTPVDSCGRRGSYATALATLWQHTSSLCCWCALSTGQCGLFDEIEDCDVMEQARMWSMSSVGMIVDVLTYLGSKYPGNS